MLELKNIYFERDNKKILDDINLKIENDKFQDLMVLVNQHLQK